MARKPKVMPDGTRVVYKKRRGGKVAAGVTGGVLTGAALVYFFGGGLGMGLPSYSGVSSVAANVSVSESVSVDESVPVTTEYEVVVKEDVITLDGTEIDMTTLQEKLGALEGEYVVNLVDYNAIKATFEEVENFLKDNNINYSVSHG